MDKYDLEIERLLNAGPLENLGSRCYDAWFCDNNENPKSCLFQYVTPTGKPGWNPTHQECGCLTQIRNADKGDSSDADRLVAWTEELTERIVNDQRIVKRPGEIRTRADLEVFAEYQRELDRTIRSGV